MLFPRPQRGWLFPTTRRYCPPCLAGDGSPIQQKYGGPWNVLWRLPNVFACTRHGCFLEHLCPICQQPIAKKDLSQLVPRANIAGLHPAQCRGRSASPAPKNHPTPEALCGWRLDQRTPPAAWDRPTPEYLALQQRILDRLDPDNPAEHSARYFTELHLTSALVIATWPLGAPPGRHRTAHTATTVLAERRQLEASRRNASNAPPTDARACAAVLLAADTILNAPDLREALAPLAPPTGHGSKKPRIYYGWDALFRKSRHECAPAFQLAVDDVLSVGRRGPDRRTRPRRGTSFRAEHVPAFLRDEWVTRHLSAFPGIPLWQLRRGAAVRLVKRARGGSIIDAARFLGVLPGTDARFDNILTHRLKDRGLTFAFEAALDDLEGEELHHRPTDYERRRQALKDWAIPP
ncbi:TniQ family protein [Streptomyces sp. NPDC060035]|uniref:TniQ family protein n=1 Tax=Streptomyces sp. NPDC060035 TaxID=3347044 RepID=UPI0036A9D28C